jgi:chemotaxis protein CheX
MIAGQARAHLANEGLKFQASTPTVIIGKNHTLSHVNKEPILAIPFTTPQGQLVVEMSIGAIEE